MTKDSLENDYKTGYDYINSNFIPFAFHYNQDTVVTREGDQIQVIKLNGFLDNDTIHADLRKEIKKTLLDLIDNNQYAIYIHTVRTKKNLDDNGIFKNFVNKTIHEAWCAKNYWRDKFVNELYISIVKFRPRQEKVNLFNFAKYLFVPAIKNKFTKQLSKSVEDLTEICSKILVSLNKYGARKLEIKDSDRHIYSEIIEFYSKIINVNSKYTAPIAIVEMSQFLAGNKIAFGNDTLEVNGFGGKSFASIYSFKELPDLTSDLLDKFLQLPQEFIITQINILDNNGQTIEYLKKQSDILKISNDRKLNQILNLDKINNEDSKFNYLRQQSSLMVIAHSQEELQFQTDRMYDELSKLGLMAIREDINLESIFYSQLPGNFSYIKREKLVFKSNLADFASLHNFTAGAKNGKWGKFLTIFRTSAGTPYFFNFFSASNGHTLVTGDNKSGKTTMMNFLISEAAKYLPNILAVSNCDKSDMIFDLMNFEKIEVSNGFKFDPFYIKPSNLDAEYIETLLFYLVTYSQEYLSIDQEGINKVTQEIADFAKLFSQLEIENRYYSGILELLKKENYESLAKSLLTWQQNNSNLIEDKVNLLDQTKNQQLSFHKSNNFIVDNIILLNSMQNFLINSDKKMPHIFYLEKANKMFFNIYNAQYLKLWMNFFHKYNGVLIMSVDGEIIEEHEALISIFNEFANKFIFPTNFSQEKNKKLFNLDDRISKILTKIDSITRQFVLSQGSKSIVAELNLTGLNHILALLRLDDETKKLYINLKSQGMDQEEVLIKFFEEIVKIKNEKEKDFFDFA